MLRIVFFVLVLSCGFSPLSAQEIETFNGERRIPIDTLESFISNRMKDLNTVGMSYAFINKGKVVYSNVRGYANIDSKRKVTRKTIFESASISKSVFAYFVMKVVEDGKLDLDKPLFEYMEYADIAYDERYKKITARMVLSHTTGFPNWREDYGKDSKLFLDFIPGSKFQYSGEGYQYLAKVIAKIYNTDLTKLDRVFQRMVARPLEMKHTMFVQNKYTRKHKSESYIGGVRTDWENDYWYNKNNGIFSAPSSLHTNTTDFSKFIIALINEEKLKTQSFVEMFMPQATVPEDNLYRQFGINDWGLGFFRMQIPLGIVFGHGGSNANGFESLFVFNKERKWGFIVLTNSKEGNQFVIELFQYLNTSN